MVWIINVLSFFLCTFVGLYFIKWQIKRWKFVDAINRIPGPPTWPLIGNTEALALPPELVLEKFMSLAKQYGTIYRIWMGPIASVTISEPEYIKELLKSDEEVNKPIVYKFLEPWLGQGILTSKGETWHLQRKMIAPTFHFTVLEKFIETFNEKTMVLIKRLQKIPPNAVFDICPLITDCALDIICETAMGIPINVQDEGKQNNETAEYISGIREVSKSIIMRLGKPWLYFDWMFFNLSSEGEKYAQVLNGIHNFTDKVIKEKKLARTNIVRKKTEEMKSETNFGTQERKAFLDYMLEASEEQELSDVELKSEVNTIMFGGHDTTSVAMCWVLLLLGNHPEVQAKVFEELSGVLHGKKRPMTLNDLREMKYLEMVIKESLRLYPSVALISRLLKNDLKLGAYIVPGGTEVKVMIYDVHRNPKYYQNPEVFNPDNFLPENTLKRHPFAYLPFSAGPRNCIGQKYAFAEAKVILSNILLNFKVVSAEKMEYFIPVSDLMVRPKNGAKIKLHPRSEK